MEKNIEKLPKKCIACGSNKLSFYSKYYQCNSCLRKYRWSGDIPTSNGKIIEEKILSCGKMDIFDTHIEIYEAKIPWEDIKGITAEIVSIPKSRVLYIYLYIHNGEKYKQQLKLLAYLFSYTPNKLYVESVTPLLFTKTSQEIIMKFFRELKEKFGDKKAVQKIDLENIENKIDEFRKDGAFLRWSMFIFLFIFIFLGIFKALSRGY